MKDTTAVVVVMALFLGLGFCVATLEFLSRAEQMAWFADCTKTLPVPVCEHGLAVLRGDRDAPEKEPAP